MKLPAAGGNRLVGDVSGVGASRLVEPSSSAAMTAKAASGEGRDWLDRGRGAGH